MNFEIRLPLCVFLFPLVGCGGAENNISPEADRLLMDLTPLTNETFEELTSDEMNLLFSGYAELQYKGNSDPSILVHQAAQWASSVVFRHNIIPLPSFPREFWNIIPIELDSSALPITVSQEFECKFGGYAEVAGSLNELGVGRFSAEYVNCRNSLFDEQSGKSYVIFNSLYDMKFYYERVSRLIAPNYQDLDDCNCTLDEYIVTGLTEFRYESDPYYLEQPYIVHVENITSGQSYFVDYLSTVDSSSEHGGYSLVRHNGYVAHSIIGVVDFFTGTPFTNSILPDQGEITLTGADSMYYKLTQRNEACVEVKSGSFNESEATSTTYYLNTEHFVESNEAEDAIWECE